MITVQRGDAPPSVHRVDAPLLTIGAAPDADIPLDDLPDEALTLRYAAGGAEIINGGEIEATLGGATLGARAALHSGAVLEIGDRRLEIYLERPPRVGSTARVPQRELEALLDWPGYSIWILDGPARGACLPVRRGVTLGGDPSDTLQIDDVGLTRSHLRFELEGTSLHVAPGGVAMIDDQPLTSRRLRAGDRIHIGAQTLLEVRVGRRSYEPLQLRLHPLEWGALLLILIGCLAMFSVWF